MSKDVLEALTGICQVTVENKMDDGTYISGVVSTFRYADGTTYDASANNLSVRLGESYSVYSQANKCVRSITTNVASRRPDNTVGIVTGNDPEAPAGKCYNRSVWIVAPPKLVDEGRAVADGGDIEMRQA